jgi:transposase
MMSGAVKITRHDVSSAELRRRAKKEKNPLIVRRILAIALVLAGADRKSAAQACGMDRQTLRDWVHRYNAEGVSGLRERRSNNHKSPLTAELRKAFAALVELGPDPAIHGVVRWRQADLQRELKARFGVDVHERTVGSYLAQLGYRRLSVRPQHPDADPQAQQAFKKTSPKSSAKRSRQRLWPSRSKSGSRMRPASAPAGYSDPGVGQARIKATRAARSALLLGLSVRRSLSRHRQDGSHRGSRSQCRNHEHPS